ncbi:MAG: HEAT repeat domain-containing protein [Candidatus Aminicenantales bacterium]|jgi:HEAT repeat protein
MKTPKLVKSMGAALLIAVLALGASFAGQAAPASLDQILKAVASYNGGIDSAPFWALRDYVYARKDDPAARAQCEKALLAFLGAKATPTAKMAVCRHLRLIGGDESVPVLAGMLTAADTSDMALYALAKIPGPTADRALREALVKTSGATQISVMNALGVRGSGQAVPALASFLGQTKSDAAKAAASVLGRLGGPAASAALTKALAAAPADLKIVLAAALLSCGEQFLKDKDPSSAAALYDKVLGANLNPTMNLAAMRGKISASGDKAAEVLMSALQGNDSARRDAAILKIREVIPPDAIGPICRLYPVLPERARIALLPILAGYPKDKVLPVILAAAKGDVPAVRLAALKALELAGDATVVPFLAETGAKARGAEQAAARNTLASIKGQEIDAAVVSRLDPQSAEDIQSELLLAVSERRIFAAKSAVASFLDAASPRLRLQAVKGLRTIGTPSDIPAVLDRVLKSEEGAELQETQTTAAALAMKIANPDGRSNAVKSRLAEEKPPAGRARLIAVLGRIGDDSALPQVRTGLAEADAGVVDAAVRALAGWPTGTPIEDIWKIAKTSSNETHRLLALQGFIRLTAAAKYRLPGAAVGDLKLASESARRPEEKRLILAALPIFAGPEALELAKTIGADPAVKAEADAAVRAINERMKEK